MGQPRLVTSSTYVVGGIPAMALRMTCAGHHPVPLMKIARAKKDDRASVPIDEGIRESNR